MNGFANFIYMFGAVSFAVAVPTVLFWVIGQIERPARRRR